MVEVQFKNTRKGYYRNSNKIKFTDIKVLNDTVASLFAGLTDNSYDAYIGPVSYTHLDVYKRQPILCAQLSLGPFIPKLQGQFA